MKNKSFYVRENNVNNCNSSMNIFLSLFFVRWIDDNDFERLELLCRNERKFCHIGSFFAPPVARTASRIYYLFTLLYFPAHLHSRLAQTGLVAVYKVRAPFSPWQGLIEISCANSLPTSITFPSSLQLFCNYGRGRRLLVFITYGGTLGQINSSKSGDLKIESEILWDLPYTHSTYK